MMALDTFSKGPQDHGFEGVPHDYARTLNKGYYGRIETRESLGHHRPGLFGLPGDQEAMDRAEGGGENHRPPGDGGRESQSSPATTSIA